MFLKLTLFCFFCLFVAQGYGGSHSYEQACQTVNGKQRCWNSNSGQSKPSWVGQHGPPRGWNKRDGEPEPTCEIEGQQVKNNEEVKSDDGAFLLKCIIVPEGDGYGINVGPIACLTPSGMTLKPDEEVTEGDTDYRCAKEENGLGLDTRPAE